jgi:hypothetical protein
MDESALEAELEKAERSTRLRWDWVNKPITLWALSTIAVGLISFSYTRLNTCITSLETDNSRFTRLMQELGRRIGTVYGATLNGPFTSPSVLAETLDPDRHYQFSEFKGRLPSDIVGEEVQLLLKWRRSELAAYSAELQARRSRIIQKLSSPGPGSTLALIFPWYSENAFEVDHSNPANMAAPGGLFELVSAWPVASRFITKDSSTEDIAAVAAWAQKMGVEFLKFDTTDLQGLGTFRVCMRRAVWPFRWP